MPDAYAFGEESAREIKDRIEKLRGDLRNHINRSNYPLLSSGHADTTVWVELAEPLPRGGSAKAKLLRRVNTSYVATEKTVTIHDPARYIDGKQGDIVATQVVNARHEVVSEYPTPPSIPVDQVYRFEITSAKNFGEDCVGKVKGWREEESYSLSLEELASMSLEELAAWEVNLPPGYYASGEEVGLVDTLKAFGPAQKGACGWAVKMKDRERVKISTGDTAGFYPAYEIIFMQSDARYLFFTLTEDMGATEAGEAAAAVGDAWGAPGHGESIGSTMTVVDSQGLFADCKSGDKGLALLVEDTGVYTIVRCGEPATAVEVEGKLDDALSRSDASQSITVTHSTNTALAAVGATLTVANLPGNHPGHTYLCEGDKGGTCRAIWYAETEGWRFDWVECPVCPFEQIGKSLSGLSLEELAGMSLEELALTTI